jgi:hypothetical protein
MIPCDIKYFSYSHKACEEVWSVKTKPPGIPTPRPI